MRPCVRHAMAALVSLAAACGLAASAVAADGTTTPAPEPCTAAGIVAILVPGATAFTTVGPALAVAERTGTDVPTFADAPTGVSLADAQVGAEGCVGGSVPGGATARSGAWSVFDGAVAGTALRADLVPAGGDGSDWHLRSKVEGLTLDGAPADLVAGASIPVSNWGMLDVRALVDAEPTVEPLRYWASALRLTLTRAHAGLPAGTQVLIGYVGADRRYATPPPVVVQATTTTAAATTPAAATTTTAPTTTTTTTATRTALPATAGKGKASVAKSHPRGQKATQAPAKKKAVHPQVGQPLKGTPALGAGSYVFPIDGRADWGDSYGGERSDVPGGWHHGDDLFAPLGTPVVAVTDGIVFSAGWNRIGGWRLWLLDANGNQYYYAHLSGYTAAGSNDRSVRRGQVLGFVGNTGDAVTTAPHLHFEVHPSSTLYLGYDGAVDPTSYLRGWSLAQNVVVPPPVALPSQAPPGRGSVVDFRRLLSVHPLRRPVKARPHPAAPTYLGRVRAADQGAESRGASAPERLAAGPPSAGRAGSGDAAIVAGFLLLLGAVTALVLTARAGRSSSV